MNRQLAVDVLDMRLDRGRRDAQDLCGFGVGVAARKLGEDIPLPRRQGRIGGKRAGHRHIEAGVGENLTDFLRGKRGRSENRQFYEVVADAAPNLEIFAVRPSWVRVSAADGTVLFEKVMDAGERFALPKLEEAPVLRTGESGAIYFAVNGQAYGPVGARGAVTKNIKLAPEALSTTYAAADLDADRDLANMISVANADSVLGAPAQ